ncbi:MAG: AbrB/MazE/SpoVT family DNA-binding domain-containing protein [Haloglomus sp.]
MTDDENDGLFTPTVLKNLQEAAEGATRQQQQMLQQVLTGGAMGGTTTTGESNSGLAPQLSAMSQMATFKTRVQSGGRISIPDAEREALDIEEGDIVQTVVIPVKRKRDEDD